MAASKADLRTSFLEARRARPDADRLAARAAIRDLVLGRCRAEGWTCVAAYVPMRTEPGSIELLDGLVALGARVLVPVTLPDRDLDWAEWPGFGAALGRDAIADADAVLVPALAVASSDGTRLGRGGGSYDRALLRRRVSAAVVALLFDGETVDSLPTDGWDVPVAATATPSGWFAVGADEWNTGVGPPG